MQTITPNTSLAQVIQNPLGRDLLEKVLLNFGFKPEDFERSALSKLKVKALSPLTGGVIKKSTVQMFCDLLNSESNAIIAPDDSPITPQWWKEAVFYQIYPRSVRPLCGCTGRDGQIKNDPYGGRCDCSAPAFLYTEGL